MSSVSDRARVECDAKRHDGPWQVPVVYEFMRRTYDEKINKQIANNKLFKGYKGEKLERPYLTRNGHLGHHAAKHNPNYFVADQLYHLTEDPKEENNLAGTHPEKVAAMQALLKKDLAGFPNRPFGEFTD